MGDFRVRFELGDGFVARVDRFWPVITITGR